ncbi:MAG TPA: hypothetical protein VHY59_00650 [Chthoniobacterales bacterium]|nr:hypothetical protein [Chthoniobacterales bacterium]
MIIVGAGLAGLLAANMLDIYNPDVYERQSILPNNHSSVLRFRSSIVGDTLRVPFKRVQIIKATLPWRNTVADALAYADKNLRKLRSDRSITFDPKDNVRYIAPPDLIKRMAFRANIHFQQDIAFPLVNELITISTIPMPSLMEQLGYESDAKFEYEHGTNIKAKITDCDAYISLLIPDPTIPFSRLSITGDELIVEGNGSVALDQTLAQATDILGISLDRLSNINRFEQKYFKILPIDNDERKRFIAWATDNFNIYSLGRYATWRPTLLLDDLVQDIRLIEKWGLLSDKYDLNQQRRKV